MFRGVSTFRYQHPLDSRHLPFFFKFWVAVRAIFKHQHLPKSLLSSARLAKMLPVPAFAVPSRMATHTNMSTLIVNGTASVHNKIHPGNVFEETCNLEQQLETGITDGPGNLEGVKT